MILDQLTGGFTTRVCGNPVTLDSKKQFSITYTNNDKDAYLSVNFYDVNGYEFDAYGLCLNKYTATVEGIKNKTYTGKAVRQSGLTVKAGYDPASYILSYKNNTKVGTATMTVTGKGQTIGSLSELTLQALQRHLQALRAKRQLSNGQSQTAPKLMLYRKRLAKLGKQLRKPQEHPIRHQFQRAKHISEFTVLQQQIR